MLKPMIKLTFQRHRKIKSSSDCRPKAATGLLSPPLDTCPLAIVFAVGLCFFCVTYPHLTLNIGKRGPIVWSAADSIRTNIHIKRYVQRRQRRWNFEICVNVRCDYLITFIGRICGLLRKRSGQRQWKSMLDTLYASKTIFYCHQCHQDRH